LLLEGHEPAKGFPELSPHIYHFLKLFVRFVHDIKITFLTIIKGAIKEFKKIRKKTKNDKK